MISKNEAKYIQSLIHKKNRDEEGVFIAEGDKLVKELIKSDLEIIKIFATEEWIKNNTEYQNIREITSEELQIVSHLITANRVLAIVKKKDQPPLSPEGKISLMLDGIQDPGNLGTIVRIADWFGIENIIASGDTADVYSSKVIQSTMGSIVRVNVYYTHIKQILRQYFIMPVYGALLNGKSVYQIGKIKEGIIVIGNESKGIRDNIIPFIYHPVTIPRIGGAESLNAAVAAGIILSHII